MTTYGKIKVKRSNPRLDEVPDDCGYMQHFEFNVDLNSNGVMANASTGANCTAKASGVGGSNLQVK